MCLPARKEEKYYNTRILSKWLWVLFLYNDIDKNKYFLTPKRLFL